MPENGVRIAVSRQERLTAFQSDSQTPQSADSALLSPCQHLTIVNWEDQSH